MKRATPCGVALLYFINNIASVILQFSICTHYYSVSCNLQPDSQEYGGRKPTGDQDATGFAAGYADGNREGAKDFPSVKNTDKQERLKERFQFVNGDWSGEKRGDQRVTVSVRERCEGSGEQEFGILTF